MTELEERVLRDALALLPRTCFVARAKATVALDQIRENQKKRDAKIEEVRAAIAQLRLDMSYIIFDLHATRQERDKLREKYEN
jgi:hypothetical protein